MVPVSCTNFGQTSDGVLRKRTRIVARRSRRRRNLLRPRIVLQGPTFADCRCDPIHLRASQHCDRRPRTLAEQSRSTKSIDSISPTHTSLPADATVHGRTLTSVDVRRRTPKCLARAENASAILVADESTCHQKVTGALAIGPTDFGHPKPAAQADRRCVHGRGSRRGVRDASRLVGARW